MEIILRRFFQRRRFRFADVDPYPAVLRPASASAQFSQARRNCIRAFVIEAEAVDERLLLRETEDAWSRISGLRLRGHRADLDEAEAAPGGRALPLIYRCKIVQTQSRGSVLRPRRRSLLQLREVLH